MKNSLRYLLGGLIVMTIGLPIGGISTVFAQDLVYRPANPAFGGSPANHRWLQNSADAQNPFQGGSGFGSFRDDPLENFERNLQRQILNQLSREITRDRFGDVDLTEEGSFDFERFRVDISPGPGAINIQVFNKDTGESTSIEIPRF